MRQGPKQLKGGGGGIGKIFSGFVKGVTRVFTGIFNAIGKFIGGVFGGFMPSMEGFDIQGADSSVGADNIKLTKQGTNLDIPVIYGYRRTGGRIVFVETNGTNSEFLYVVYVIAEGEIDGIKAIHVDGNKLPVPNNYYPTQSIQSVTEGRYKDRLRLEVFTGTESQGQSSLANQSKSWNNARRHLPGVAYVVMEYKWLKVTTNEDAENNPYGGGVPNVEFDIVGKKVFDTTTLNSTVTTQLDAYSYSGLTKNNTSFNPISQLVDYLLNPRFGAGMATNQINWASVGRAARKCATGVYYDIDEQQYGRILSSSAALSTKSKIIDNVKMLLSGARGFMPFIQGRYKIKIEDGGNDVDIRSSSVQVAYDVTEDDIVGGITLVGEQKLNKYNKVIVNYVDVDKGFTEQQAIYTVASDVASDGEDLIGEFTFPTMFNPRIAQDTARLIYEKSRRQRLIQFTAHPQLLAVEPGDIIRVTSTVLGLSLDSFRVIGMKINTSGLIEIEAREHTASVYPFTPGDTIEVPPPVYKADNYVITPTPQPVPEVPKSVSPPNDEEQIIEDPGTGDDDENRTNPGDDNNQEPRAVDEVSSGGFVKSFVATSTVGSVNNHMMTGVLPSADDAGHVNLHSNDDDNVLRHTLSNVTLDGNVLTFNHVARTEILVFESDRFTGEEIKREIHPQAIIKPVRFVISNPSRAYISIFIAIPSGAGHYYLYDGSSLTNDRNDLYGLDVTSYIPAVSYVNLDGDTVTGTTLEAYINNKIQSVTESTSTNTQSWNLGA